MSPRCHLRPAIGKQENGRVDGSGQCAGAGVGGVDAVSRVVGRGGPAGVVRVGERHGEVGDGPVSVRVLARQAPAGWAEPSP